MPQLLDEPRATGSWEPDFSGWRPPEPGEEFVEAGWWPYFKEHVNREGVIFDRVAMQRICDRLNERIDETGDYAPLVLHHTRDDDKNFTPEYVGLIGPYRLGKVGNRKPKWAIFGREMVRSGKEAALKEFPRRSVEYWADSDDPTNGYFDPISALPAAITPELDLGIHYARSRDGRQLMRYSRVSHYQAEAGGSNTFVPSGTEKKREEPEEPDRYQQGGTLSQADIQQIVAALKPTIAEAVKSEVAAMRPVGADPEHLLSDETGELDGGTPNIDDGSELEEGEEPGQFAGDDEDFENGDEGGEQATGDEVPEEHADLPKEEGEEESADDAEGNDDDTEVLGKKKKYSKPSDHIAPAKAREILEDGEVHGHPLTDKQRGMFGAAAHYDKMCQYMADDDDAAADLYWKELDDDSRTAVRSMIGEDADSGRRERMNRYMADCPPEPSHGAKYMATETLEQKVTRYEKESADYRKQNDALRKENTDLKAKYQKEVDARRESEANHQQLAERVAGMEARERRAVRYQKLADLQSRGYTFDVEEELEDCKELNDAQFDKHVERIASKYQRVPPTLASRGISVAETQRQDADGRKQQLKVERYSKQAADNVMRLRHDGKEADFKQEFDRLMQEDPDKIGGAAA